MVGGGGGGGGKVPKHDLVRSSIGHVGPGVEKVPLLQMDLRLLTSRWLSEKLCSPGDTELMGEGKRLFFSVLGEISSIR